MTAIVVPLLAGRTIGDSEGTFAIAEWTDPGGPPGPARLIAPLHVHHRGRGVVRARRDLEVSTRRPGGGGRGRRGSPRAAGGSRTRSGTPGAIGLVTWWSWRPPPSVS